MNWGQYSTFEKGGFHVDKEGSDGVEVKNSVENSAKFTRSLTIFKALDRLDIIKECKERNVDVISIHLLGADYVEAKSPERVFEALSRLLYLNGIHDLDLFFSGPNLDCSLNKSSRRLFFPGESTDHSHTSKLYAKTVVKFCDDLYHAPANLELIKHLRKPDLIVCFNAGIWGYDSWKDTITAIITNSSLRCPCIVTSYNKEEADDDHVAIKIISEKASGILWNWKPSHNIFSSLVSRESGIPGRLCIENNFWQAFSGFNT